MNHYQQATPEAARNDSKWHGQCSYIKFLTCPAERSNHPFSFGVRDASGYERFFAIFSSSFIRCSLSASWRLSSTSDSLVALRYSFSFTHLCHRSPSFAKYRAAWSDKRSFLPDSRQHAVYIDSIAVPPSISKTDEQSTVQPQIFERGFDRTIRA